MPIERKTITVVADKLAEVRAKQAPTYFEHPEYQHPNGDPVVYCAPAEMKKDLLDRGHKLSNVAAYEEQGKTTPPGPTVEA